MTAALRAEERAAPYVVAPLLTDQLDTFASAPEGFKRLRELVLNLAVRGRLVPQDAKDEPADKLLDRIRVEKTRLGAKREKQLEPVLPNEQPYELPRSWRWVRLPEICHEWGQKVPDGPFTYIDVGAIDNEHGAIADGVQLLDESNAPSRARKIVRPGTVIYSTVRPYLLNIAIVDRAYEPEPIASTAFAVLHPLTGIDGKFLFHYLRSSPFIEFVDSKMVGVAYPAINDSNLFSGLFPLAPVAEQSRIVAKVEELMALIAALEAKVGAGETARGRLLGALLTALADSPDAAATADAWAQLAPHFDLLLQTPADVDRLQQTLLQLAVKGRLVPQNPKDEPAAELLKRIRVEKERLFTQGKSKRDKPQLAIGEDEKSYDLPDGWQWARVPAIADTRLGKMLDKAKNRGHLKPYLRNTNVQWFRFDLSDVKELRLEDAELSELRVLPGDLLICEGGEPGRCAIWKDAAREIYFQKALHRVRTYCGVLPEFVQLCLRVDCVTGRLDEFFTGATIKHFPGQALNEYCVPLPPLPEQSRIVAAVASLTTLCDRLRESLAARRELSAKLAAALTETALQ